MVGVKAIAPQGARRLTISFCRAVTSARNASHGRLKCFTDLLGTDNLTEMTWMCAGGPCRGE